MKSKIKSISRNERGAYIIFKHDSELLKRIDISFRKMDSKFKLSKFRRYKNEKWVDDFYELSNTGGDFDFTIVVKNSILKLKIKASLDFVNNFLKEILKVSEF